MQGTVFGSGAPFGFAGVPTAWSGPSFGAQGVNPAVAPQQLIQLLQFVPQQLQKLQHLEYLQQQQLQQLQLLLQVIPQQLHYIQQAIQYLPQHIQQYQQSPAISPFQSTGVPFGGAPQLWSQGLSQQTGQVM